MKETELLGKLLPGHHDIFPIIKTIREKYQIPEVRPEDDNIKPVIFVCRIYDIMTEIIRHVIIFPPLI